MIELEKKSLPTGVVVVENYVGLQLGSLSVGLSGGLASKVEDFEDTPYEREEFSGVLFLRAAYGFDE